MEATSRGTGSFVIGSIVAFLMLLVLIGLGTWQIQRLQWKERIIADRIAASQAEPVTIGSADLAADRLASLPDYRRVRITGSFDHAKELHLASQFLNGRTGWHIITPFRLSDGGAVLVNRGFVPYERADPATRLPGQLTGEVTLDGLIVRPGPPNSFTPGNKAADNMWYWVDIPAMARAIGVPSLPSALIAANRAENPGGLPIGLDGFQQPRNDHFQYALTWYGLAVLLIIMYLLYSHQRIADFRRTRRS